MTWGKWVVIDCREEKDYAAGHIFVFDNPGRGMRQGSPGRDAEAKKGRKQGSGEKDPSAFKLGDRMVIKNGKIMKEVKPITGGY